ncbi:5'-nucleotidase /3'-nucleotidase /exopolyphosphatase [Litorimonas taeanensis]|uniref:5'-nucleotidase SurE n=1 Tax=Litorimonas taeanensis TaxID=568099 RepID=A0A420WKB9_9PROT|nr:5'/3'-nucleotidase SurE [Litorimonas taeanensis]RKQ71501.1 5'-nucleotidase /3'-nucleotidase /exopolyphosphatase [Litorimonas taeanensis]
MKILLTNDDGVRAEGMKVLRRVAAQLSDDVWVCAPDTEQSAASRGVSLHNPVRLRKIEDRVYSVTGTPTDSVILALKDLLCDEPPDLILSGVNRGQNLAEDVTFSGTVAGALQGMQMGIPSIAISLARGFQGATSLPWETAEALCPDVIKKLLKASWPKHVVPNVNIPDLPAEEVKGIQITRQGHRDYQMSGVDKRDHPRGGNYFWLTYGAKKSNPPAGTDLRAIYDGYVSVTPLHTDLTHFETLDDMSHAIDE